MIRVAAVGDVHVGPDSLGTLRRHFETLPEHADMLLVAGDVTRCGDPREARVFAREAEAIGVPVMAVLGNHDYHADRWQHVREVLEDAGIRVLEGETSVVQVNGASVAVSGVKGFGGGFAGACGSDFGEPEMKAFVRYTKAGAAALEDGLQRTQDADARIALLHYSPVEETLRGERPEIYPFLGSYLLAEAIDRAGADLVVHGHAHNGAERGITAGGVPVRNVAQPVIRRPYTIYCLRGSDAQLECATA